MKNSYDDYEEDSDCNPYAKKYFCFDLDAEREPGYESLRFYTSYTPEYADDCPPGRIYDELNDLLKSLPIDVGAAESMHMVSDEVSKKCFAELKNDIRKRLTNGGWIEISDWGCPAPCSTTEVEVKDEGKNLTIRLKNSDHELYEIWNECVAESVYFSGKPSTEELMEVCQKNWGSLTHYSQLTPKQYIKKWIRVEPLKNVYASVSYR